MDEEARDKGDPDHSPGKELSHLAPLEVRLIWLLFGWQIHCLEVESGGGENLGRTVVPNELFSKECCEEGNTDSQSGATGAPNASQMRS